MDRATKSRIRDQFIAYAGREEFQRFVNVLVDHKLGKGRLRYWQEELWRRFLRTFDLNGPVEYREIVDTLNSDLEEIKPEKTTADYIEFPEPFGTQYFCSDDNCPCNDTPIPPAKGYLYIPPGTVEFRKDCPTLSTYWAKLHKLKQRLGGAVLVPAPGTLGTPIVLCEQGAKLRNLDLEVAAADFDLWVANRPVPCRSTPTRRSTPREPAAK